jgi:DNA-binding transcriptional LysR family regulator
MATPDLNLLVTLDVLLSEGSVAGAARKLRLSPSAMSRALARLRETTGDPLLVRAGRGLVPTTRALALREPVRQLVQDAEAVLRPTQVLDLERLTRTFVIRTREGFVETFGPDLIARVAREAPGVRLRFLHKPDRDGAALRDGAVDLETGVLGAMTGPEVRIQALFRDRFVGVVRPGHALTQGEMTAARYAQGDHVFVARGDVIQGAVDEALAVLGLERRAATVVEGFSTAVALTRASDLIATVPERYTTRARDGLHSFTLPFPTEAFMISLLWHPRRDGDPAHRWLRGCFREVCADPRSQ